MLAEKTSRGSRALQAGHCPHAQHVGESRYGERDGRVTQAVRHKIEEEGKPARALDAKSHRHGKVAGDTAHYPIEVGSRAHHAPSTRVP